MVTTSLKRRICLFALTFCGVVMIATSWHGFTTRRIPILSGIRQSKKILFYTTIYGEKFHLNSYLGASPSSCEYRCEWSNQRDDYNDSDAVIFSLRNFVWQKDFVIEDLPARRDASQVWAFHAIEPQGFFYPDQLKKLNNMFNLSITFQSDSDVSLPLGVTRKISPWMAAIQQWRHKDYFSGKDKLVSWLVGNCVTGSRREVYVQELKKYIDVDIYGGCGNHTEESKKGNFREILAKHYMFYLSFENSDCDDYITEKFWLSLKDGMIPVVRGHRVAYKKYAPPNSYIHADTFSGPKELAEYLKKVASNETLFNSFQLWRKVYETDHSAMSVNKGWVCDLCKKLYVMSSQTVNVYEHFGEDTRCFTYLDNGIRNRTNEKIQDIEKGPMLPNLEKS